MASGYVISSKSNVESEAYIVSIPVDLTASKGAMLEFDVLSAYPDHDGEMRVLVTDKFNENEPNAAQWVDITGNTDKWATGDFNTFVKYQADIPAQFIGKDNVRVALYKFKDMGGKEPHNEGGSGAASLRNLRASVHRCHA